MAEKFEPLHDQVVIEPSAVQENVHGLAISDQAKTKPKRGTVIAVGPGRFDEKMILVPGDIVVFEQHMGIEIDLNQKKYLVMKQSQLLCKISSDDKTGVPAS